MKPLYLTLLAAGLSLVTFKSEAQSWDFQYSYQDVFASNAQEYVVQQQNIATVNEGDGISYWCPITNGIEATLTQEFTFPNPTAEIFLMAQLYIANFASGEYGNGSLWGSTDGTNWTQLENAPTPAGIAVTYNYETNLPSSLTGSKQLWIQTRLQTSGWNIMAQFSRDNQVTNTFELYAKYTPRPLAVFVKAFTVDFTNLAIGSNYQAQASQDMVTWTNWGTAFTATNSSYTNTNYQRIADWNQLFFRLVQP